jgi:hypothetical protein
MIRLMLILLMITLASAADAQLLYGITGSSSGGGSGVIPTCTNSFDFSNACNSQYLGAKGV